MRQRLHALWASLRTEHASPGRLAAAVFVGINVGVCPIYGVQTPLCLLLAWLFRLNKITVVLAANISNPLIAPFIVAGGIVLGEWVRFGTLRGFDLEEAHGFLSTLSVFAGEVPGLWVSCLIGDAILGLILGTALALVAWRVAARRVRSRPEDPGTAASGGD